MKKNDFNTWQKRIRKNRDFNAILFLIMVPLVAMIIIVSSHKADDKLWDNSNLVTEFSWDNIIDSLCKNNITKIGAEELFESKFKNKKVQWRGKVKDIKYTFGINKKFGDYFVEIENRDTYENSLFGHNAEFIFINKKVIKNINIGQMVSLEGEIFRYIIHGPCSSCFYMKNCKIILF